VNTGRIRGATLLIAVFPWTPDALLGQLWRADERVVITDYRTVEAVAADERVVYAVTAGGICAYDHRFRRWELPVAKAAGAGWGSVSDAVVDPTDESLWLGTEDGLVNYQPRLDRFERTVLPGGVAALWLDPRDPFAGIYLRSISGWQLLPRGGTIPVPADRPVPERAGRSPAAARLTTVLERYPALTTLSLRTLVDDRMRTYRFTTAAEVPTAGAVFLGTNGMGVVRFDVTTGDAEPLPYGLLTNAATAVVPVSSGVWVGGDNGSGTSGVTFVSKDLQRYEYLEGPPVTGVAGSVVNDLLQVGPELWLATDAGLAVFVDGRQSRRMTSADGLPGGRVLTLAGTSHGMLAGTERGLARVADGIVERVGDALYSRVNDLAIQGDSIWVASAAGLGWSLGGSDRLLEMPGSGAVPELREEIVAVVSADDVLAAATRRRLLWRIPSSGDSWVVERPLLGELGEITALAVDVGGVWIGGARGLARYRFESRQFTFFNAPGDVPGPVWDLAIDEQFLWVATDGGLVRFDLDTVRGERE